MCVPEEGALKRVSGTHTSVKFSGQFVPGEIVFSLELVKQYISLYCTARAALAV